MAWTYTRQHVTKVAREAVLQDDVLVIADTNVWFDYFDPAPGAAHDTDYEGERSYPDAMIKSCRLYLPKLIRDELTRVYNGRYRRYMDGAVMPAPAEFNLVLRDRLDGIPVVRQDRRHSLPKVEEMYARICGQRGRHRKELHGWGASKSRDASGRPNWGRLDPAARPAVGSLLFYCIAVYCASRRQKIHPVATCGGRRLREALEGMKKGRCPGAVGRDRGGPAGAFDSKLLPAGGWFFATLDVPGTYEYGCAIYPWINGEVAVAE
ncbi:MAG: hypothetical protein MPK62_02520 [Alphaproteobacteria bacterium]|nr:hypothetical protein [Alphaproteobacteria bacterium]MDA8030007.1 hypothetical protein [Alphaproteobacteria bacterium]